MLLALINEWGACPPDGYRYVFPQDGFLCHAWTYVDWVQVAKNHLTANNKPIPDSLEADMQHQLCLTLPPGWCNYDDDNRPRPSTLLDWGDVAGGLKTFAKWAVRGFQFVPQVEAERRAVICSRCYLNVNVQGCSGCQKAVEEVVAERKTKHDSSLRACAVCKCFLRAKVHFPISTLDTASEAVQQMYPDFCWLNRNSDNFQG
jgi:hypothetical protein